MAYANCSVTRPAEIDGGGRGRYCCIPQCMSSQYDRFGDKSGIAFFAFPDEVKYSNQRKAWMAEIYKFRRKGGADSFKVNKSTKICEFHFLPEEIKVSHGIGRKTLLPGVVPSIFKFREKKLIKKRKLPAKRNVVIEESTESEYEDESEGSYHSENDANNTYEEEGMTAIDETGDNNNDAEIMTNYCCQEKDQEIKRLTDENIVLQIEVEHLRSKIFNFENISTKPGFFKKFTGLGLEEFTHLFDFLQPGENCENVKMYESGDTQISVEECAPSKGKKRGPKTKLKAIEQLFLFMTWLKCGLSLHFTSWIFDTPKSTVSRYIITWANFLYFSLGEINIWPSVQNIQETMPETFKKAYPSTRCIIDCTELFCQRPGALTIQSALYSSYKHHVTYKGLVGISPSGAMTFISQLYEGSISDKDIVSRSGILSSDLWNEGDSLMADRGFDIQDMLTPLKVKLNIPAFLAGRAQLTKEEVKKSQSIASVRIHVERAINRIKKFRQIRNEIPLTLHGSINQIWTVACLLCNFLPPLIQKDISNPDQGNDCSGQQQEEENDELSNTSGVENVENVDFSVHQ